MGVQLTTVESYCGCTADSTPESYSCCKADSTVESYSGCTADSCVAVQWITELGK